VAEVARLIASEDRLNQDVWHDLREVSMHFEKESAAHKTLERMTKRLNELGVAYALAGGMAAFSTATATSLRMWTTWSPAKAWRSGHEIFDGLDWRPPFAGSKNLRDTESGVRVEFLITGEFPGDGKPKPVAFPDPQTASIDLDGIRVLSLPRLIELKIISGSVPGRLKDLGDVQEPIRTRDLPESLAEQLHPSVQDDYRRLWSEVRRSPPHP
jgi:hypothetical protein